MRKQLITRRALRSRTAVVHVMVPSAVERIGAVVRAVRRMPYPPLTRFNQKMEDRVQPKLSYVPATCILYSSKMKMSMETPQI